MTATADLDAPERLLGGYTGRMFVLITAGLTVAKFSKYVLSPLLPTIIDDLAITPFEAGLALSLLQLCFALAQYPGGRLSDELSRPTVLVAGLAVLLAGFAVLVGTPTYAALLAGAILVGVGQGLYGPADRAYISDLFTARRGRAFGFHVIGTELAGVLASGVALVALSLATWRAAFVPGAVVTAVCLVLLYRWAREPLGVERVSLDPARTIVRLFSDARYRWVLVAYSLFAFIGNGVIGFLPTFLQAEHGFTASLAGTAFAGLFVAGTLAKPTAGHLSDRVPRLTVAAAGLLVGGLGIGVLVAAPTTATAIAGVLLFAVGHRAFPPVMQAYLMDRFPDGSMGGDLGVTRTVYVAVGSLGPAYVGIVASHGTYAAAFAGFLVCFAVGAAILWRGS